jgi:hypothetical protein
MERRPEVEVTFSDQYRVVRVGGWVGGSKPTGIEVDLYEDKSDFTGTLKTGAPPKITHEIQAKLFISPFHAKEFAYWLLSHVKGYEEHFGAIAPPKKNSPARPGMEYAKKDIERAEFEDKFGESA